MSATFPNPAPSPRPGTRSPGEATPATGPLILQVEDSEDDVFMMKRVLKKAGVEHPVRVAWDGQQAVDYLAAALDPARRDEHPLPFLVLLDLKLPYRDGFEVLEWIRGQPGLREVMVVMLTGSGEARDRNRAMELGARAYLVKPASIDDIRGLLERVSRRDPPGLPPPGPGGGHS